MNRKTFGFIFTFAILFLLSANMVFASASVTVSGIGTDTATLELSNATSFINFSCSVLNDKSKNQVAYDRSDVVQTSSSGFAKSVFTGLKPGADYVGGCRLASDPNGTYALVYFQTINSSDLSTLGTLKDANGNPINTDVISSDSSGSSGSSGNLGSVADTNTITSSAKSIKFKGLVPVCNVSGSAIDKVTNQYTVPCDFTFFMALINSIIRFLLFTIATPFLAIIIVYVGYLYLTSGGSNQTEKAKHILLNVVVGYVIALSAWLVINTIIGTLKVDPTVNTFMDRIDK